MRLQVYRGGGHLRYLGSVIAEPFALPIRTGLIRYSYTGRRNKTGIVILRCSLSSIQRAALNRLSESRKVKDFCGTCWTEHKESRPMCCCYHCSRMVGYFEPSEHDRLIHALQAVPFDQETGFWKAGQGCTLPRALRSDTCIGYFCGPGSVRQRADMIKVMFGSPCKS